MKIVVSVNISSNYILLLIVSGLNFNRCTICFLLFLNIACRSTQNTARIPTLFKLHIVIKPLNNNKKINIIKSLLCLKLTLLTCKHWTVRTANLALVKSENLLVV